MFVQPLSTKLGTFRPGAALAAVLRVIILAAWFGPTATSAAFGGSLFGSMEFRAGPLPPQSAWRRVFERIEQERSIYQACGRARAACPSRAALAWEELLESLAERAPRQQLDEVNRFVNRRPYKADPKNGHGGRWSSPLEFFERSGDCEDYAVAKYVTLRRLGIPAGRLRIVVVRDLARQAFHAVLAVRLTDGFHILDNLAEAVRPEFRVGGYVPIYAVNEMAVWVYLALVDHSGT